MQVDVINRPEVLHGVKDNWIDLYARDEEAQYFLSWAFMSTFLRRFGLLREIEGGFRLQVEPGPFDVLLERLPWGFAIVKLPWMREPLFTEWSHG